MSVNIIYNIIGKKISPASWQITFTLLIVFWIVVGFLIEHRRQIKKARQNGF